VLSVRELDSRRDGQVLADLMIALQNHERQFDPGMPEGSTMVRPYLELMLGRCSKWDGKVFVAEEAGVLAGFICVWAHVPPEEPDDDPADYAFISDVVVTAEHRHRACVDVSR
jgi:hypothetical protein